MPPSAGAIRAGRAFVELFADDSRLVRGLKAASAKLKAWGASMTLIGMRTMAAGAALATPFVIATKAFMSAGDKLDKMSARVGVSVEFLSALSHAAQIGGTDLETMEKGIRRLQRSALDASRGLSTQVEAFDQLGVSVKSADGQLKHTDALFMETVTALSQVENETQKAALAQMLFGRSGTALLPMLKGGKEGLLAVMEEAHKLGIVMTTEDATAAAALTDAWTRLKSGLNAATVQIGAALAPALESAANWMKQFVAPTIEWIRENRGLVFTVAKVTVGIVALGSAFIVAGTSLTLAGIAVSGFAIAIGAVGTVLGAVVSPIGLAVAALAGIVHYSGAGGKALEWLGNKFSELREFVSKAWGGIADAIAAGDLSLAMKIAWASIRLIWAKGINWLIDKWIDFKYTLAEIFTESMTGLKIIFTQFITWLSKSVFDIAVMLSDMLNQTIGEKMLKRIGLGQLTLMAKAAPVAQAGLELAEKTRIAELGRKEAQNIEALSTAKANERKERLQNVEAIRAEWDALIMEANRKRRAMLTGGGPARAGGPPEFEGAIRQAGLTVGTFSKFALGGLGMGGGPAEQTARNTKDMAKDLNWLRRRAAIWAAADKPAVFGK